MAQWLLSLQRFLSGQDSTFDARPCVAMGSSANAGARVLRRRMFGGSVMEPVMVAHEASGSVRHQDVAGRADSVPGQGRELLGLRRRRNIWFLWSRGLSRRRNSQDGRIRAALANAEWWARLAAGSRDRPMTRHLPIIGFVAGEVAGHWAVSASGCQSRPP